MMMMMIMIVIMIMMMMMMMIKLSSHRFASTANPLNRPLTAPFQYYGVTVLHKNKRQIFYYWICIFETQKPVQFSGKCPMEKDKRENFVIFLSGKTLFLIGSLGGLCNTLKFERVLFDYNDQCHGW